MRFLILFIYFTQKKFVGGFYSIKTLLKIFSNSQIILLKKIQKYNSPNSLLLYPVIFTQKYTVFLWEIQRFLVRNNNMRGRNRPARSGNRYFINYLKKLCYFIYCLYILLNFISLVVYTIKCY